MFLNLKFFITEPQKQINIQKVLFDLGYSYKEDYDTVRLNDKELYIVTFDDGSMIASEDLEDDYDLTYSHHKEMDLRSLAVIEGRYKGLAQGHQDITKIAVDQSLKDAKHLWLLLGVLMDEKTHLHKTFDYHQAIELQMLLCKISKTLQKTLDRMD